MDTLEVVLVALAFISNVSSEISECPKVCPDTLVPTCATDGDIFVQFDNPCALSVFNCKRQRSELSAYTETDIDWCTTTELNEFDEQLSIDLEEIDTSCLRICPMIYTPICASNGTYRKYFSNECEMNLFNCVYKKKNMSTWRILMQGKCSLTAGDEW